MILCKFKTIDRCPDGKNCIYDHRDPVYPVDKYDSNPYLKDLKLSKWEKDALDGKEFQGDKFKREREK